ncbi:MAG TPA: hypothetical protein VKH18_03905 [Terriglobales bacterium]|nr:hypothetical protein [Terriglobales bacterium]
MNRQAYASILGLVFLALVFLTSCNSSNFNPPAELIAPTSGTPQSAAVNTAFAAPLVATVTMGGSPVSGAFVTFTAPATGASGTFAGGTSTETDTTNASGVAISTAYTANGTLGANTVTASVAGVTATTSFNLMNTSGPAASITATSGSLQDATISTAFAAPLVATVVDSNQYPVTGASVTFTAPAMGASGTFANGTATETDTTNASGVATSSKFTADAATGAYIVTAAVAGVAPPANFSLTNITGAVISITATSGTPQSTPVNAPFAAPLIATVTSNGLPVSGALVTFEVPATGAGGTFAGGVNTATTNASGVATSAAFTANGSVGTYTVTATVASGAEPANFILTNTAINFAFYLSGLEVLNFGPNFYALAGSVTVDGNGNVLGGKQDYSDGLGLQSPEPSGDVILPGAAALTVDPTTGQGTLMLTTNNPNLGVNGVETLGVQFVNTNHALIIQFDGSATSSGSMDTQTLSSTLNDGNYAFTLSGVDPSYLSIVFGGVFSISNSGTTLAGTFDVDDFGAAVSTPTLGTSFSGTISGPDAFGRGTITSSLPIASLNYYVVGPEALRIIDVDVDTGDAGVGSAFGQGTGTFSNASLGSSVFGVASNSFGNLYAAAGMFTTVPDNATFSGVADDNEYDNGTIVTKAPISGTYSISNVINGVTYNGYGSLTITAGDLGDVSVLGIYMTDPLLNLNDPNNTTSGLGGALVAELDGFDLNGTGVLVPQTDTAAASFAGNYAFGTQVYNDPRGPTLGWEFDFVGQGSVTSGALSGAGLVSDPFFIFNNTQPDGTDTATFSATASPDPVNAGRYTTRLDVTVTADPGFAAVIYQAGGGQLFWLDTDENGESVFLGSLQQQGSLTALPAARKTPAKAKSKQKH